jgi:hypothetical protein
MCKVCGAQKGIDSRARLPGHRGGRDDTHLIESKKFTLACCFCQPLHMQQGIHMRADVTPCHLPADIATPADQLAA